MKQMFILQGAPGSGKTSLINRLGVNHLTVSRDTLRDIFSPTVHSLDGETRYATIHTERDITDTFNRIVTNRLRMGSTIFIDGTHPSKKSQGRLVDEATKYGYTCYLVNMQQATPLEELINRNRNRTTAHRVDENILEDIYRKTETEPNHPDLIPVTIDRKDHQESGGAPEDALFRAVNRILISSHEDTTLRRITPADYSRVIVFGDVHSCSTPLHTALDAFGGIDNPSNLYIFVGDLFDRGPDPLGVYETVAEPRDNVILLEGNHEKNLREILHGTNDKPYVSTRETVNKLTSNGVDKRDLKRFCTRLVPYLFFTVADHDFFITHGGVTNEVFTNTIRSVANPALTPADREYIYGTSDRAKAYRGATTYTNVDHHLTLHNPMTGEPITQIHGHRNTEKGNPTRHPIDHTPGVYNLEQGIEDGGHLGVAVIDVATGTVTPRLF